MVNSLLQANCDPNAADLNGMTPVLEACQAAHELTLTSLLEKVYFFKINTNNCRVETHILRINEERMAKH